VAQFLTTIFGSIYHDRKQLPADEQANQHCIASGRPHYYGGWDLHRRFHKPMKGYFPAGSVFQKQINDNCIEL